MFRQPQLQVRSEDTLLLKLSKVSPIIFESENEFMRATQVEDEVVKLMQNVGL